MRELLRSKLGDSFFLLAAAVVVADLILGGATRSGYLSNVVLQLLAIPLLLISAWRLSELPSLGMARIPVIFCSLVLLLPVLQCVPLPPGLWTLLPHRQTEAEVFSIANQPLPWMPISTSPRSTMLSALSLMIPASILLGTILLDHVQRARLSLIVLAVGVLSVFLGLTQVAQGGDSSLRFYDFNNASDAIGFFANRNHFASLLCVLTVLAGAWAADAALIAADSPRGKLFAPSHILPIMASFIVLVALLAGEAMTRSRGGLSLTILALVGILALVLADRRGASGITPARLIGGAVALAVIFSTQFALYRIMERFAFDPMHDSRIAFARTTADAARDFMPFGSGIGTFVPVYAAAEKPADLIVRTYANRAHDDWLELWLETGIFGPALVAAFLCWLALRSLPVWRPAGENVRHIDTSLARAATLVVVLILAHSVVDYPLRTSAISAIFAFACGLLVEPLGMTSAVRTAARDRASDYDQPSLAPAVGIAAASLGRARQVAGPKATFDPQSPEKLWQDMEWPEEWRRVQKSPRGRE